MARGRMLDEVIILSQKINKISEGAENLYYRLLVKVDDYGRFHANPKIIKGQIYILKDNISITKINNRIQELYEIDLIKLYNSNNEEQFLEITDFEKHQTFRKDIKRKAIYPQPVTYTKQGVTNTEQDETKRCLKLSKDKLSKVKLKGVPNENHSEPLLSINFNYETAEWENIKETEINQWGKTYPACDIKAELLKMADWCISNPEKRKKKWRAFITRWLSKQQERGGTKTGYQVDQIGKNTGPKMPDESPEEKEAWEWARKQIEKYPGKNKSVNDFYGERIKELRK